MNYRGFEDVATCLLEKGLEEYQQQIEKGGNYWNLVEVKIAESDNDPLQWKSGLNDVKTAVDFVKCLPCQDENTSSCKERMVNDGYIKDIVDMWKTQDTRKRKCNVQTRTVYETTQANDDKISLINKNFQKNETNVASSSSARNYSDKNIRAEVSYKFIVC